MEKEYHRKFWPFLLLWVLLSLPLAAQQPLSLSEAVARALGNNPDLAIDAPGQQAARSEYKATRRDTCHDWISSSPIWPATILCLYSARC